MISIFRKKWFAGPICALVSFCHLAVISFVPYAYSAESTATATSKNAGAQSAVDFYNTLPAISASGSGSIQYGQGQSVDLNHVYPDEGSSTSLNALQDVYGNDSNTTHLGTSTGSTLSSENSLRGEAYRTLTGASQSTAALKDTDSIFNSHKDFLENKDKYMQSLGDCSVTTTVNKDENKKHIPDYKECTRTTSVSGTYQVNHPYVAGVLAHNSGPANIQNCGEGCIELWVGTVGDNYWWGNCSIYSEEMSVNIVNANAISSVKIIRAKWDDYMQIYIGGTGAASLVWAGPYGANSFPPETAGKCELSTSWDQTLNADVTNKFKESVVNGIIFFKTRVSVTGQGEGFAKLRIQYDPKKMLTTDVWTSPSKGWDSFLTAVNQGYCQNYSVTCKDSVIPDQNGCATIDGAKVCKGDFKPTPLPELSPFCKSATVVSNCGTDAGVNNTCKNYDTNNSCNFIKSTCITGAAGGTSGCWQASEIWDCGTDISVPSTSTSEEYECPGSVQCINGTCLSPGSQPSGDFETAAAMLQAATYALNDLSCVQDTETSQTCTLFKGEAIQCKTAMGGWVDCCNQPVNVSWIQYLQLTYYTLKVADAVSIEAGLFEQGKGIFDMGSELMTNAIDAITKPAMSALDSLTGNAGGAVAEQVSDFGISAVIDETIAKLTAKAAEWTLEVFGEGVTNMLFQSSAGGAAAEGGQLAAGGVELSSALVQAVSVIGYAYMAYMIANILVNIIWACTEDEFKLAVKKETKLATYISSWCQTKVLGQCIEKRTSYCTYNSQIARIIQEQGRQQLGIGWGNSKNPDCRGFTMEEFGKIDFGRIDLSEWIASLYAADLLPTSESVNIDSITGSGSILNIDGTRKNSLERFESGVDSIDVNKVKSAAKDSISVQ